MWSSEEKSEIIKALNKMKKLVEWAYSVTGDAEKTNRMFDEISNIRAVLKQDWLDPDIVLPKDPDDDGFEYIDDYPSYLVTIKDAVEPCILHYMGNGRWMEPYQRVEYPVVAWAYLPEAYREGKQKCSQKK